ncbi:hypothetical protein HID58_003482, partial [Brassica napus]
TNQDTKLKANISIHRSLKNLLMVKLIRTPITHANPTIKPHPSIPHTLLNHLLKRTTTHPKPYRILNIVPQIKKLLDLKPMSRPRQLPRVLTVPETDINRCPLNADSDDERVRGVAVVVLDVVDPSGDDGGKASYGDGELVSEEINGVFLVATVLIVGAIELLLVARERIFFLLSSSSVYVYIMYPSCPKRFHCLSFGCIDRIFIIGRLII